MSVSLKERALRWLYGALKYCVQLLPPQLLRFRPFGVFEIAIREQADATTSGRAGRAEGAPVEVRWVDDRQQLDQLADLADPQNLRDWDGSTRRVAVAWQDEQPVGVAWIATGSFAEPELGLSYRLAADEAWLFAAVVDPQHRRRGIYTALLAFVLAELATFDVTRLLLGVSTGNEASLRSHLSMGAKQLGSIFAARCCGFGYCRTTGQVRKLSRANLVWRQTIAVSIDR